MLKKIGVPDRRTFRCVVDWHNPELTVSKRMNFLKKFLGSILLVTGFFLLLANCSSLFTSLMLETPDALPAKWLECLVGVGISFFAFLGAHHLLQWTWEEMFFPVPASPYIGFLKQIGRLQQWQVGIAVALFLFLVGFGWSQGMAWVQP